MAYYNEIRFYTEGMEALLHVTDDLTIAKRLKEQGEAVLVYLHEDNRGQDFSGYLFAVEDPEDLEQEYVERVWRRLKGLPWNILATDRLMVRETIPEDVDAFYTIYSDPMITRYMEGLYPEVEQEKQYIREYIEKVYTYYGFGVWTVIEKESGAVIGRAGISYREGFELPELGFLIGVPWQGRGYAEEVCRAVLCYSFRALQFEQVQALVEPGNEASLKLCEKLGFGQEAVVTLNQKKYCQMVLWKKPVG